jgi:hypothetical protein
MAKYNNINILKEEGIVGVEDFEIEGSDKELEGVMIKEILMTESLLTQSPQLAVILHSSIYDPPGKWFDKWKNKKISFKLKGKVVSIDASSKDAELEVEQKVYRLSDRKFMPTNVGQTEQMTVHACDETLFKDVSKLVSKSWKCTQPSKIVKDILENCVEAKNVDVQEADPARDYIAENIHPYQVIAQQANVAMDGDDPSFLHFMTYEDKGKHYFKSLKKMAKGTDSKITYLQADIEEGTGYKNASFAVNFMFPCDFDYLSDLLNGLNENGENQNTGGFLNPVMKTASMEGKSDNGGCSQLGGSNYKVATTNKGSSEQQNSCNVDVEKHLVKRQARMGLLDRDKIALRITVPCNLELHVGQVISLQWINKKTTSSETPVYGTGDYLIASMTHNIKLGGFSVTTMDCVSVTVAQGQV